MSVSWAGGLRVSSGKDQQPGALAGVRLHYVLSDVWFWRGGLTRNALHKATLISNRLQQPSLVLTTEFDPDTDVSVQRMTEAGLIGPHLTVRNLFEDAGVYGGAATPFFSAGLVEPVWRALDASPDLYPVTYERGSTVEQRDAAGRRVQVHSDENALVLSRAAYDRAGRVRSTEVFDAADGNPIERRYLDPDGRCRARYRRDPSDDRRWIVAFRDETGEPTCVFDGVSGLRTEWLSSFAADTDESVFQVESENHQIVRAVLDMDVPGVAKVMMMHSSHLDYPHTFGSPTIPAHAPVLKRLDEFDAFVLITPTHRDDIAAEFGPRSTLHAVPHDAPPPFDAKGIERDPFLAVGIGRFTGRKNWDHAIRAFSQVRDAVPEARFELWGMGPLEGEYRVLIEQLGLADRVRVMGHTTDARAVFARAGFSVLTGIREGFGLVLLESLSSGTPVVVYDGKYGPRDMLRDGVDGILVPHADISGLAKAMIALFSDAARQRTMGRAACEISERFSAEKCVQGWLDVYRAALEQRDSRVALPPISGVVTGFTTARNRCSVSVRLKARRLAEEATVRLYVRSRATIVGARYVEVELLRIDDEELALEASFDASELEGTSGYWDLYLSVTLRNAHRFVRLAVTDSVAIGGHGDARMVRTAKGNASVRFLPRASLPARIARAASARTSGLARDGVQRAAALARPLRDELALRRADRAAERESDQLAIRARYAHEWVNTPLDSGLVAVETLLDDAVRCNPRALVLQMLDDPGFSAYRFSWAIQRPETLARLQAQYAGTKLGFVARDSLEHLSALATAGHVITNGSLPGYFQRKPNQVVLNTWHGIPVKRMGFELPGGRIEARNVLRVLMHCDYLVSGSAWESEALYLRSHKLAGIYPGTLLESGHPRIDTLLRAARSEQLDALRSQGVALREGQHLVLYAPTWRGSSVRASEDTTAEIANFIEQLKEQLDPERFALVLKLHPLTASHLSAEMDLSGILVPCDFDTSELLAAVDVLVTDYSSIFVDFLATGRPVVFHLHDLERYVADRGVYIEPDELPGPNGCDAVAVAELVRRAATEPDEHAARREELRARLLHRDDGHATDRVLSAVFGRLGEGQGISAGGEATTGERNGFDRGVKRVLLHVGALRGGPSTRSSLALLQRLATTDYDVSLIAPYRDDSELRAQLAVLPDAVRTFLRSGKPNQTRTERLAVGRWLKAAGSTSVSRFPEEPFAREWDRQFGGCDFDAAIDLAGSSPQLVGMFACARARRRLVIARPKVAGAFRGPGSVAGRFSAVRSPADAPYLRMVDPQVVWAAAAGAPPIALPSGRAQTLLVASRDLRAQRLALSAFARARPSHPAAHMVMLARGDGARQATAAVRDAMLEGCVSVVDVADPLTLVARCGCLIVPVPEKKMSPTTLEALALELPTLIARGGEASELLSATRRLVDGGAEGLASAIDAYLSGMLVQESVDLGPFNDAAFEVFLRHLEE